MKTGFLQIFIISLCLIAAVPAAGQNAATAAPTALQYDSDYDSETPPAAGVNPARLGIHPPRFARHGIRGEHRMHRALTGPRHRDGLGRGHRARGVPAEHLLGLAQRLELTEEQVNKLEKLAYNTKKQLIDLRAAIAKERLEMRQLHRADSDDLASYKTHIDKIAKTRAQIEEARIANLIDSRKVLTDKQKDLLKKQRPRLRMPDQPMTDEPEGDED